jgi:hypothetical protein
MHESVPDDLLMQITDGHPACRAVEARRSASPSRINAAEHVVLVALLRHAREKSLKARVFGDPGRSASNYPHAPGQSAGN